MINIEELRLGNIVRFMRDVESVYEIVDGIYNKRDSPCLSINSRSELYPVENFAPVELTPELLEACGFAEVSHEYERKSYFFDDIYVSHYSDDNEIYYGVFYEGDWVSLSEPLKYLHQLQNLYFALTGSELQIKQLV